MRDELTEVLRLRLSKDLKKEVERFSFEYGESMSVVIRHAIRDFIKEQERQRRMEEERPKHEDN
jgi:metal-responsive CopG/Arc/MetJ family transcriptional regulator